MAKKKILFRRHYSNALTIPLLLNILEKSVWRNELDLMVSDEISSLSRNDLVIFSLMTPFLHEMASEIRFLADRGVQVVVGGPHVAADNYPLLLRMGAVSASAAPAETGLPAIVAAAISGNLPEHPFWQAESLAAEDWAAFLPYSAQLPTLPPLELMRGCGYCCSFCATAGRNKMIRDLPDILAYLDIVQQQNAHRVNFIVPSALDFFLEGYSVTDSLQILFEQCARRSVSLIEYGIFPSEIRPETVTPDKVAVLKRYVANTRLTLGVQSGAKIRLKSINRSIDDPVLMTAVETIRAGGFGLNIDMIVGFPGENYEEFRESVDFALFLRKSFQVKLQFHRFFPLGNSRWQWKRPAEIDDKKKKVLEKLEGGGVISAAWRHNDAQWQSHWQWLRREYPDWADRYH